MGPINSALVSGGLATIGMAGLDALVSHHYGHAPAQPGDKGPYVGLVAAGASAVIGLPYAVIGIAAYRTDPALRPLGANIAMAGAGMMAAALPGVALGWMTLRGAHATRVEAPGQTSGALQ